MTVAAKFGVDGRFFDLHTRDSLDIRPMFLSYRIVWRCSCTFRVILRLHGCLNRFGCVVGLYVNSVIQILFKSGFAQIVDESFIAWFLPHCRVLHHRKGWLVFDCRARLNSLGLKEALFCSTNVIYNWHNRKIFV